MRVLHPDFNPDAVDDASLRVLTETLRDAYEYCRHTGEAVRLRHAGRIERAQERELAAERSYARIPPAERW